MGKKPKTKRPNDSPPFKLSYSAVIGVIFWLIFIIGVWYAGKVVYAANAFVVKDITCNIGIDPMLVSGIKGSSLFGVDTVALQEKLALSDSDYREVTVKKQFPSKIEIIIIKRRPFVQVKYNGFYTIDRDGVVIDSDPAYAQNLLTVEIADCPQALSKGVVISTEGLNLAKALIFELKKRKFFRKYRVESINTVSFDSAYFVILTKNPLSGGVQVKIGGDNFSRKLFVFDNLMASKIKGDLEIVKYIDLRYKKAYVGYKR